MAAPARRVGFIGLGQMGGRMARNLMKLHPLVVYDLDRSAAERLRDASGGLCEVAGSPAEVGERAAGFIVSMLPSTPHVREAYCDPARGVLAGARAGRGALLVDCSTIEPGGARAIAQEAAARGFGMVDAPVSGGVAGAEAGTLTFMVGGGEREVEEARPLLACMGKRVFHTGPLGAGQAAKICNNAAMAVAMVGLAEALQLGARLGVDPRVLSDVINASSARSWASETYNPCPGILASAPASRGYAGGFASHLMAKDLGLAAEAAASVRQPLPLSSAALQVYTLMAARGMGPEDFSAVFKFLQAPPSPAPAAPATPAPP
eukprot:tig00000912_g5446.t1